YPPQPDRDAGSRTMFDYLKLFAEAGFHVCFWPQNLHFDPIYTPKLQRLGIETFYGRNDCWPAFTHWLDSFGEQLDYAFVSRPNVAIDFLSLLTERTKAKVLYYGHDIHFRRLGHEYALTHDPSVEEEMLHYERVERAVWPLCDTIYYLSKEECE